MELDIDFFDIKMKKGTQQSIAIVRTNVYNKGIRMIGKEIPIMAQKSANLYARIEPDVKEQAENILSALGVNASNAINMFYKQIILHRGIPFDVTLPVNRPLDLSSLSAEELSEELEKGYADMKAGRTKPAKEVFANIRKDYGV